MALCPGFVRTEFHQPAGMAPDNIPGWMRLDADKVVDRAEDLARGKTLSIPDPRYKALMGGSFTCCPAELLARASSTTGRRYGPR